MQQEALSNMHRMPSAGKKKLRVRQVLISFARKKIARVLQNKLHGSLELYISVKEVFPYLQDELWCQQDLQNCTL